MQTRQDQGDREIVASVKRRLLIYVDEASEAVRSSGHVVGLLAYFIRRRDELTHVLRAYDEARDHELVWREAQAAYLTESPDPENRSELLRNWFDALIVATEKVDRDRQDAELYAAVAADADGEDSAWNDAAQRLSATRWRDEE